MKCAYEGTLYDDGDYLKVGVYRSESLDSTARVLRRMGYVVAAFGKTAVINDRSLQSALGSREIRDRMAAGQLVDDRLVDLAPAEPRADHLAGAASDFRADR